MVRNSNFSFGYCPLEEFPNNAGGTVWIKRSISSSVFSRPSDIRIEDVASSSFRPMAFRTYEGVFFPEEQAELVAMQNPISSSKRINSLAFVPGMEKLMVPGKQFSKGLFHRIVCGKTESFFPQPVRPLRAMIGAALDFGAS